MSQQLKKSTVIVLFFLPFMLSVERKFPETYSCSFTDVVSTFSQLASKSNDWTKCERKISMKTFKFCYRFMEAMKTSLDIQHIMMRRWTIEKMVQQNKHVDRMKTVFVKKSIPCWSNQFKPRGTIVILIAVGTNESFEIRLWENKFSKQSPSEVLAIKKDLVIWSLDQKI